MGGRPASVDEDAAQGKLALAELSESEGLAWTLPLDDEQWHRQQRARLNALIDTGALITGYSNRQVAEQLLASGLGRWCEGVVFLDEGDEKMILVRAT